MVCFCFNALEMYNEKGYTTYGFVQQYMPNTLKKLIQFACFATLFLVSTFTNAQVAWGVGFQNTGAGARTAVYSISPTTGVASTPTVPNAIPYESSAMAVSPINGFVYYIERTAGTSTPRFGTWDPNTGAAVNIGPTGTTAPDILRATFCPNGRFYIGASGANGTLDPVIFEINALSGAVIRSITLTGAQAGGSGDIVCVNSGDLYLLSATSNSTTPPLPTYTLYKVTSAQLSGAAATGPSAVTPLAVGDSVPNAPNGIYETPTTLAGCALSPNPCLMVSGGTLGLMYTFDSTSGAANTLTTASGARFTDMSREFPRDVSISKSVTPTTAIQSSNVVTYTLIVRNPGPAVAGNIAVQDSLPSGVVAASATWSCSILAPGDTTALVTSACASASGSGPLNTTVSLSIGGTAQLTIRVPLSSSFSGTLTNTASAILPGAAFDSNTANNIVTITSTVSPATNLSVTKTDGVLSTAAGSTTNYTVTFVNSGPGDGAGSVVKDVPSAGLSNCSVISCGVTGLAVCPTPISNLLTVGGSTVATFPASSSLIYTVRCGVSATGL
jgi:uncharacterized repeat protein (TIGR01451 family)